jgi:NitT/TauT family transport system substrate-binding protein
VLASIAEASKDTLASYKEQLSTTHMYYTPQSAAEMTASPEIKKTMDLVRQFCFSHNLLGEKTKSADDIGIQFADGTVLGNSAKVRLRFSTTFMQLAAQGKL